MAFKIVFAFALLAAAANAGYAPLGAQVYHTAPAVHAVHAAHTEEYDPHPQYKFSYGVDDSLTGDSKSQVEERDGDVVRGEYSLVDADGFKRTVQYTADDVNGFNAVVHREPLVKAAVAVAAPVAHYAAAPAVVKTIAAPVVVKSYAAPAAHYTASAAHYAAAPAAHYSAAPAAHYAAPAVHYSAPAAATVLKSVAPIAAHRYAAPLSYAAAAPAAHYAAYSSPAYAYHH